MNASPIVIGLVETGVLLALFFALGAAEWIKGSREEEYKYCERVRKDRMIRQPVNTWSNMGFVAFGLAILAWLSFGAPRDPPNPMTFANGFSIVYGMAVIWLGPGSMFLHGSQKHWGGVLDNMSMNMFLSWFILYDISRLFGGPGFGVALAIWLVVNAALGAWVYLKPDSDALGRLQFFTLIALLAALEVLGPVCGVINPAGTRTEVVRSLGLLAAGAGCFVIAYVVWRLAGNNQRQEGQPTASRGIFARLKRFLFGDGTSPYCKPESIWQGHAAWHLLGAVATFLLFIYLRSERGA